MPKELKEIIERTCAVCGKEISVRIYKKLSHKGCNYRGGHYFGKIPFYTKREIACTSKQAVPDKRIGWWILPKMTPYKYEEYWECPKCYWRYKK